MVRINVSSDLSNIPSMCYENSRIKILKLHQNVFLIAYYRYDPCCVCLLLLISQVIFDMFPTMVCSWTMFDTILAIIMCLLFVNITSNY